MLRSRPFLYRLATFAAIAASAAGCTDGISPAVIAGVYQLVEINGEAVPQSATYGAISGEFVLDPTGSAVRRLVYRLPEAPQGREFVARGSFKVESDSIRFALREDGYDHVWHPSAARGGNAFTLGYPGAADGAVREVYRRR